MRKNVQELHKLIKSIPEELFSLMPDNEANNFRKYRFFPIELLTLAVWNYKEEDEFMQRQLVNNIKTNGQIITCQLRALDTGYLEVVDGNHRLNAFLELGYKYVIAYDHGDISLAQAQRIALESNETHFKADKDKLSKLLQEINAEISLEELSLTMPFAESDLDNMLNDLYNIDVADPERPNFNDVGEDEFFAEEPIKAKSVIGDLYELNNHRLLCGSSTKPNDVAKLMNGEKAHLLYTDPPYNVKYAQFNKDRANGKDWTDEYCSEWKDDMTDDDYKKFLIDFLKLAKDNLIEWAHYYVWHATSYFADVKTAFEANDIPYDKVPIQWIKQVAPPGRTRYWRITEPCLYGGKGAINGNGKSARWFGKIGENNAWIISREHNGRYIHPTQKPLALSAKAIINSSQNGEIVLDMFGGSGSTLISCDILGRIAYLMELEPKFIDLIVLRYFKYCKDRNLPCVVKRNGEILEESFFEYPKELNTKDDYEPETKE